MIRLLLHGARTVTPTADFRTFFVSNLRGPEQRLSIFGCPVTAIVPLSTSTGNVTVSFTVLSYAGDSRSLSLPTPMLAPT